MLGHLEVKAPETLREAVYVSIVSMMRDAIKNKMTGQYLGVVTGTARRSIAGQAAGSKAPPTYAAMQSEAQSRTRLAGTRIVGEFGSPLGYVRAHEEGFAGTVQVPGHTRRIVSLVTNARGRVTTKSAKEYRKAVAAGRKTIALVRPHAMRMNIRAKHFLRDSLREGVPGLERRLERSILILAKTGRPASPSELGL